MQLDTAKLERKPWYRPWYRITISGVPLPTLIRRCLVTINHGLRDNRYRLPSWYYTTLFTALYLGGIGLPLMAIPEGMEMMADYRSSHPTFPQGHPAPRDYAGLGKCDELQARDRFWRVLFRSWVMSLPLVVSLSIFFFPALVDSNA